MRTILFASALIAVVAIPTAERQTQAQQAQTQQPPPAQGRANQPPPPPPTLGLEQGLLELETPEFRLKLVKASQTIAALEPKGVPTYTPTPTGRRGGGRGQDPAATPAAPPPPPAPLNFDFTPADRLSQRAADGFHHLGDLTLRLRPAGATSWTDYDTATTRKPVVALPAGGDTLAAADLTPTFAAGLPLQITRKWRLVNGRIVLSFDLANKGSVTSRLARLAFRSCSITSSRAATSSRRTRSVRSSIPTSDSMPATCR